MTNIVEAIKANDYMKVKSIFTESMEAKTKELREARKIEVAKSVMIEGEEPIEDEDDEKGDEGKEGEKEDKED